MQLTKTKCTINKTKDTENHKLKTENHANSHKLLIPQGVLILVPVIVKPRHPYGVAALHTVNVGVWDGRGAGEAWVVGTCRQ